MAVPAVPGSSSPMPMAGRLMTACRRCPSSLAVSVVLALAAAGLAAARVLLNVVGTLEIDGAITANGNNGFSNAGGGGSGGSINLHAGVLSGAGTIAANGGAGANSLGGGGGGGRMAIIAGNISSFTGALNCFGGTGARPGRRRNLLIYLQVSGGTPGVASGQRRHRGRACHAIAEHQRRKFNYSKRRIGHGNHDHDLS